MKSSLCLAIAISLPCVAVHASDLTFAGYSAIPSNTTDTATFTIEFLTPPHLGGADEFDFWIDPDAPDAYDRAEEHAAGDLPNSRQTFISSKTVGQTRQLQASWVQDLTTYHGPVGVGGWGAVQGYFHYTLSGSVLNFTVPLSVLQTSSSGFYYSIMVLQDGAAEGGGVYEGDSGATYSPPFPTSTPVPEPATIALILAGMAVFGLKFRKTKIALATAR